MTWGEFKQHIESHEVKDSDDVIFIDISGQNAYNLSVEVADRPDGSRFFHVV